MIVVVVARTTNCNAFINHSRRPAVPGRPSGRPGRLLTFRQLGPLVSSRLGSTPTRASHFRARRRARRCINIFVRLESNRARDVSSERRGGSKHRLAIDASSSSARHQRHQHHPSSRASWRRFAWRVSSPA